MSRLILITLMLFACSGFSPAQHHELEQCAYELVTEMKGNQANASGPVLDVLTTLRDKPAHRVAALLVIGMIESGLTSGRRGAAGEIGTFQVMPATAAWAAKQCGIKGDPSNTRVNAALAYCYYEYLFIDSGFDLDATVAAYNYGPKAIMVVRTYGQLPKVTANYLVKFNRLMSRTTCGLL